jgi:hypothetical protein
MKHWQLVSLILSVHFHFHPLFAKAQARQLEDQPKQSPEVSDNSEPNEPVDLYQIVDSPALRHLLSAGTTAANQAVTNAMDALFYSLLDRTWPISKTKFSVLNTGIERKLTMLSNNTYLVIDRMMVGPSLSRPILPPTPLGISTTLSSGAYFYEFYIVSDAERVAYSNARNRNLFSIANWFGILPLLSRILPPSFDANELYNPLRIIETPLKIPLTKSDLLAMPENTMRSYAIKGSIGFPIEHKWILDRLPEISSQTALVPGVPINFYGNAEARVTVQKQSENDYRISLSHINTEGNSIGLEIGKTFYAFGLAAGKFSWRGLPIPIFPLKVSKDHTLFQEFSEIRDIHLDDNLPEKIISEALTGNFINLDKHCLDCNQTATSKSGIGKSSSSANSGFFFDTTKDYRTESADHIVNSPKLSLNYREFRSDNKSSSWDIMNGATTESTSFSWSTPTIEKTTPPLIWGKFSLSFPYIDEHRFSEILETLNRLEFLGTQLRSTEKSAGKLENRELENLARIRSAPPLDGFSRIYPGPQIVGKLEIDIDLFASDEVIKNLAKTEVSELSKIIERTAKNDSDSLTTALCRESIRTIFIGANGLDICHISKDRMEHIDQLSHEILFGDSPDIQKTAAINFVKTIGVVGFMQLVIQTQSQTKYSFIFHSRCTPNSRSTENLKETCNEEATYQTRKGTLASDRYNWWNTIKNDSLEIGVRQIPLEVQDIYVNRPEQRSLDRIFEIIFSEPVSEKLFIFIRIETLGKLEIARSLVFEGIYEVDLGFLDRTRVNIPSSFFADADFNVLTKNLEGTRFSINASRDGKNWSAIKKIEIPYTK